ncbi:hypothetical protein niasHS_007451 [Heterodera schachtii]|uniref:HTH psq-type domain-containing protein n=1 Tax=Heterodera schachtii TaxID=97005 RepID=A0ABD2JXM4_HETSC
MMLHPSRLHLASRAPPAPDRNGLSVIHPNLALAVALNDEDTSNVGKGLENVFQRALGSGQWRKFGKTIQTSSKACSSDFELELSKNCNWCLGSREKLSLGPQAMNDALLDNPSSSLMSSPRLLAPLMIVPGPSSPPSASSSASLSSSSSLHCSSSSCFSSAASSSQLPSNSPKRVPPSPLEVPPSPCAASSAPNSALDPMRLFALHQQQLLMGSTEAMSGAERLAMAATMHFLSASLSSSGGLNGTSSTGGSVPMLSPPSAPAFFPAALFSSGFCAWPTLIAPHLSFPPPFASLPNNGSSATSPSTPPTSAPNFFDIHQQLTMAWQSQLFALNLMNSLNGFCSPPTSAGFHRDQTQEDETLAFLAAFGNGTRTKTPTENGEQQQPLDLTKCAGSLKQTTPIRKEKRLPEKKRGDQLAKGQQSANKDEESEGNASAPPLLLAGSDGIGDEDSSEAGSPKLGTKRTYSQADLDAAVTDIRMGRLGTRRASVVYGIPRSTLRNKIYKLEAAEDNGDGTCKKRRLTAFAIHKREQKLLAHRSMIESASGDSSFAEGEDRGAEESEGTGKREAESPAAEEAEEQFSEQAPMVAQMPVVLMRQKSLPAFPFLGAGVGSAEQLLKEFSTIVQQNQQKSMPKSVEKVEGESDKIDETEEGKQKQNQQQQNTTKTERREHQNNGNQIRRPKRGQYRKYEKEALDKAVASVRSGEMSVHRAGSFYGVPHSTLEYKVKERNLLRTKSKKSLGQNGGSPAKSGGGSERRQSGESQQKTQLESEVQKMVEFMLNTVEDGAKRTAEGETERTEQ